MGAPMNQRATELTAHTLIALLGLCACGSPPPLAAEPAGKIVGCQQGGWLIGSATSPRAAIERYDCGNQTILQLVDMSGADGSRVETIRARLEIRLEGAQVIVPCVAEHPSPSERFSNLMFIPAPNNSYSSPKVLRAWRADLESWEIKEIDPTNVRCYFGVGKNDD